MTTLNETSVQKLREEFELTDEEVTQLQGDDRQREAGVAAVARRKGVDMEAVRRSINAAVQAEGQAEEQKAADAAAAAEQPAAPPA